MKLLAGIALAAVCGVGMLAPTMASADWGYGQHKSPARMYHRVSPGVVMSDDTTTATAVIVGGTPIMRFRNSAGGYSPEERATACQERLNRIFAHGPIMPDDITVDESGADAVVLVKGQLLFTADTDTAALNDSTPWDLANHWADRMRAVLPTLTYPTNGAY